MKVKKKAKKTPARSKVFFEKDPGIYFVYITTASLEDAQTIAHALVTTGLAACGNIIPGMEAIYRWKGEMHQDRETVLILTTDTKRLGSALERVKQLHPFDTPCIVAFPLSDAYRRYADWIRDSSQSQ